MLLEQANPSDHRVYAGCFPGLTVVCSGDVALDRPSTLERRFLDEAAGRSICTRCTVVDWFAYAAWASDGTLRRSLSLAPDHAVLGRRMSSRHRRGGR
jgi:hypothetical protein